MIKQKKSLTIKYLSKLLLKKNLLTEEQCSDIMIKSASQKARLQMAGKIKGTKSKKDISPTEIIASFEEDVNGKKGKKLTEDFITEIIAEEVGFEYLKIDPLKLDLNIVTSYISKPFAHKNMVVPVAEENGVVTMAVVDPFNLDAVNDLKRTNKLNLKLVLSSKSDVLKTLREFHGFRTSVIEAQKEISTDLGIGNLEQFVKLKDGSEIDASDQHVVNAVEHLLQYAFDQKASDIHVEPKRENSHVRFRMDGVLHDIHVVPRALHPPIISRIKMLSRMDIAEKRRPQDGRIKTESGGKEIELRVSTMPVAFGEKVVIRVFDPDILLQDINSLGFYKRESQLYSSFIKRPNGIILVTGPTGSGKTTTLYSTLNELASPEKNIITIEDPIEMVMEQFNQVGVQSAIGVTFGNTLRTILRQDPDIIMVGEIRDKETAENSVQAALTGHLVLSTLHTNDAPSSITRLLDIGIPPFLLSSTIIGVIAQRLVRKICSACKEDRVLTDDERSHLQLPKKTFTVARGKGCTECRGTGYKGRAGVFEVMEMTDKIAQLINENASLLHLQKAVRAEGLFTIKQCATRKMLEGITTFEEVVNITG